MDGGSCLTAAILAHGGVMFTGCIDIFVSKHLGYQIDITGFAVKACTIGTAKLMRGDLLLVVVIARAVFFYHIFYGLNTYSTALGRDRRRAFA